MSESLLQAASRRLGPEALLALISPEKRVRLPYLWPVLARPEQMAPKGDWTTWLVMAGRSWGKTRTGAQQVIAWAREMPSSRGFLAARTSPADTRDVMIEGESGILACSPPEFRPVYEPSKRRLTWPNGSMAFTYSSEEPDQARGPQHHWGWADELAAWKGWSLWDNLQMGLRLGTSPRCVATTTPKPLRVLRDLLKDVATQTTGGSTYENAANLPAAYFERIIRKYEGSRLGDQELRARLLDEVQGALWKRALFAQHRVAEAPRLRRIVVAVDPAVTAKANSNMTGIIVAGLTESGHVYVLADRTCRKSPEGWASDVAAAFREFGADRVVGEVNQGGDLVKTTLRMVSPEVASSFKAIHAKRGKYLRAEPVAALYEQGFVHHVGHLDDLEDQCCNFTGAAEDQHEPSESEVGQLKEHESTSPDRVDALVHAVAELVPILDEDAAREAQRQGPKQQHTDDPWERAFVEQQERAEGNSAHEWVPEDQS